ncbi:hypothetical protein F4808DRAFT_456486 [Astrocystis sublimbata]|nr:hypothetical protein F4808DRAFT_456486 [Astrocystis sublimbata]
MPPQLSQLASQVPGFINEHSKRRRRDTPTLDLSQYFDFPAFYGEDEQSSPGSRTRSVASSDPGLTSGPSEEDGAPSPGPAFDPYHKEAIKQIKQQDDRFTVPEREIRPKGGLPYPSKIHLDNAPSPTGSSSSGNHVVILSNPGSPTMLFDAVVEENHLYNRGRRSKPLENPEKVAVMRKLGACYRCKLRKVTCDQGAPCSSCIKDAAKLQRTDCGSLADHICCRQQPATVFSEIDRISCSEMPPRGRALNSSYFKIFFYPFMLGSPGLSVPISVVERGTRGTQYQLNTDEFSLDEHMLVQWASSQMQLERNGFQSAVDHIAESCMAYGRPDILPHSDLLAKVHKLRCLYKVWSHSSFTFERRPGSEPEQLPCEIERVLKAMAAKLMKGIESDVLGELAGSRLKSSADRLPLWTCMMQIILLYRDLMTIAVSREYCIPGDLHQRAERLMNFTIVMCDLHFKKPLKVAEIEAHLKDSFIRAESSKQSFFMEIRQQCRPSDSVLVALLAKGSKGSTRPPPSKKLRK